MYYLYEVSSLEDFEPYYLLKCQKDAVKWSGFEKAPDRDVLLKYFNERVLGNPQTHLFYMKDSDENDAVVGYKQYDDIDDVTVEIRGTVIFKRYQGCGLNDKFSLLLGDHFMDRGIRRLITYISENNKASLLNIKYCGFHKTEEYEDREMRAIGEVQRFYKWELEL